MSKLILKITLKNHGEYKLHYNFIQKSKFPLNNSLLNLVRIMIKTQFLAVPHG